MLNWHCKTFQELTTIELYAIIKARQDVFVIEQNCIYPDLDNLDQHCLHLFAKFSDKQDCVIGAYLRILPPDLQYSQVAFGRVLTTSKARGLGAGKELVSKAIEQINRVYPSQPIKISAQLYLQDFYQGFGFETISDVYDEDGIDHISMLLKSPTEISHS